MSLWHYLVFFLIIGLVAIGNFGREAAKQMDTTIEKISTEQVTDSECGNICRDMGLSVYLSVVCLSVCLPVCLLWARKHIQGHANLESH